MKKFLIGAMAAAVPPGIAALRDLPVLVVDDNETSQRLLEVTLRGWHMQPVSVAGGDAALEVISGLAGYQAYLIRPDGSESWTPGMEFASG